MGMNEAGIGDGIALCGIAVKNTDDSNKLLGRILSMQGLGATRVAIPATTNDSPNKWAQFIYSCIASMTPIRFTCGLNSNDSGWVEAMQGTKQAFVITFPIEEGFDDGAEVGFDGGYIEYQVGGELQTMLMVNITIQPTGKPVVTEGTPSA